MTTEPGPFASDKLSETSEPAQPEPQAAETESARLLANQSGPALRDAGLTDEEIRRLADEYIACDHLPGPTPLGVHRGPPRDLDGVRPR
jgi:hypothetical protein